MDDILANIRGHINERLNSPLFGAYALAWLFWNYKVPLLLFSSLDVHDKITQIDAYLHADIEQIKFVYGFPLAIAAGYIFILPIPSTLVTAWTLFHQNVLAWVQKVILKRRVVTAEELAEKEEKWRAAQDAREKRLQELEITNEGLRNHRTRLDSELNEAMVQLKSAVDSSKAIPELHEKIGKSSERIDAMSSEVAHLKEEIQARKDEAETTEQILISLADWVERAGLVEHMHNVLNEAIAYHPKVPGAIEGLISYLAQLNVASPSTEVGTPHIYHSRDPAMDIFGLSKNPYPIKDYVNDWQIIEFLRKYCEWTGSETQLVDSSIDRFKIFSDVVGAEGAAELYSLINAESPDFDSMSYTLKKGLRDLVKI